jgi:ABC-type phosphate transport system substrate-binding protein
MEPIMRLRKFVVAAILALGFGGSYVLADVVAVVSARSAVPALNKEQVAAIFLGKASRFPDGGPAVPIDQTEGSPTRDAFYVKLTGKSPAQLKAYWAKIIFTGRGRPPLAVSGSSEVKQRLAENPHAIGYIEYDKLDGSVRALPLQ